MILGYRQVLRTSIDGTVHRIWERTMPRIRDTILDCSIFLYGSEEDAKNGTAYGGSGFLVGVPVEPALNHSQLYAVTNSHVIEEGFPVVRVNSKDGGIKTFPLTESSWIYHPTHDDVAISPIDLDRDVHKYKYITPDDDFFITRKNAERLRLGAGDEAFMVGRYLGRDEKQSNVPIVRSGHVASGEPAIIDQEDGRKKFPRFPQESYLVEVHSVSGFSGSPVFVWIPRDRINAPTNAELKARHRKLVHELGIGPSEFFLGIDWGHVPGGMAGVVPAWKLNDLLYLPEVIELRKEQEEKRRLEGRRGAAVLDVKKPETQKTRAGMEIGVPMKSQIIGDLKKASRRREK
jgi:hypothetical protein